MLKQSQAFTSYSIDNLDACLEFYSNTLGLDINQTEMGFLQVPIGDNNVVIYPKENHVPAEFTVLNFQVENVESAVDELISRNVTFEKYDGMIETDEKGIHHNDDGSAIAWFKDPAGNVLAIIG